MWSIYLGDHTHIKESVRFHTHAHIPVVLATVCRYICRYIYVPHDQLLSLNCVTRVLCTFTHDNLWLARYVYPFYAFVHTILSLNWLRYFLKALSQAIGMINKSKVGGR